MVTPHNNPKERCPKHPNLFLRAPFKKCGLSQSLPMRRSSKLQTQYIFFFLRNKHTQKGEDELFIDGWLSNFQAFCLINFRVEIQGFFFFFEEYSTRILKHNNCVFYIGKINYIKNDNKERNT